MGLLLSPIAILLRLFIGQDIRLVVAVAFVAVLSGLELLGFGGRLPQNRRLVPQTIMAKGQALGPVQFGFEMGTGVRTYVTTAMPMLLVVSAILVSGTTVGCIGAGLGFGMGRSLLLPLRRLNSSSWDLQMARRSQVFTRTLLLGFGTVFAVRAFEVW